MNELVRRGTKSLMREINNSRVLQIIQVHAPISRAEIAKMADLQPPTVTAIVNGFLRAGLVRETDIVRESDTRNGVMGRRPILLSLNDSAAFAVGVKLRQEGLTVAITDLGGALLHHADHAVVAREPERVLDQVAMEVNRAVSGAGVDKWRVLGLGIGMPGLIDHVSGVCRYSSLLDWRDVDVKGQLESLLDMPVYVDNDVNMVTAAEIAHGAGREMSEFLVVTIGQGIGLGLVLRGEIYRGAYSGAGEFGHIKVGGNLRCECGAIGCLEAIASDAGICVQVAALRRQPSIDIEEVLEAAASGDPAVRAIFREAGQTLGRSVGNLLNLFNPQLVIVTGEGTRAGDLLLEPMREAMYEAAFGTLGTDARLVVQSWGDEAWARGAAGIVVHEMLKPPIYESGALGPLAQLLDRGIHRAAK